MAESTPRRDYAMFDAKRRPHESVAVFDPEMRAALDRRRYLEGALPAAIENDEFEWWGQPILSTLTLQPVALAALAVVINLIFVAIVAELILPKIWGSAVSLPTIAIVAATSAVTKSFFVLNMMRIS